MISLTSQIILWALLLLILWYVLKEGIPRDFLRGLGLALIIICLLLVFIQPTNAISLPVLRVLSIPLKPLGLTLLLLILGIRGIKKGSLPNVARNQIIGALLVLLIFSMPFVAYGLAQLIEKNASQMKSTVQTAPVIVVMGWGTTQPQRGNRTQVQLTETGDRIRYTAELYKAGLAARVIVSAGRRMELRQQQNAAEANDIKNILVENMNLPSDAIIVEPKGVDVRTSAEQVAAILKQQNLGDRIYLVSSALNIRRAALTFASLNIKVIPKPTNFYTFPNPDSSSLIQGLTDFIPNTEALALTSRVIDEYLISIYYFMRSWLLVPSELNSLSVQKLPQQTIDFKS